MRNLKIIQIAMHPAEYSYSRWILALREDGKIFRRAFPGGSADQWIELPDVPDGPSIQDQVLIEAKENELKLLRG